MAVSLFFGVQVRLMDQILRVVIWVKPGLARHFQRRFEVFLYWVKLILVVEACDFEFEGPSQLNDGSIQILWTDTEGEDALFGKVEEKSAGFFPHRLGVLVDCHLMSGEYPRSCGVAVDHHSDSLQRAVQHLDDCVELYRLELLELV